MFLHKNNNTVPYYGKRYIDQYNYVYASSK